MKKLLLAIFILLSACQKNVPDRLRIGIIKPSIDHLPLSFALSQKQLAVKIVPFTSGWEVQEAIIHHKIDLAIMPYTYVYKAQEEGYSIKTVSFLERETDGLLTQPEVSSFQDLNGKKIGVLKASTLELLLKYAAQKHGFTYQTVYFRTPNEMIAALRDRSVAAISIYEPLISKLSQFKLLHWYGQDLPAHPCCNIVVHEKSLKNKQIPEILQACAATIPLIERQTPKIINYMVKNYNLTSEQAKNTLNHTIFKMGLDHYGKQIEYETMLLYRQMGYLKAIADTSAIYYEL